MSTFAQWSRPSRLVPSTVDRMPRRYDIRVVDQFYGYCQAVARAHRHRDEARIRSQFATRRVIAVTVLAGGLLCYYLLERLSPFFIALL